MKKIIAVIGIIIIVIAIIALVINFVVLYQARPNIITKEEAEKLEQVDAILILGAGIIGNQPSHMLEDRLLEGIALYEKKVAPKIIMSGDHGQTDYDEVTVMKEYAIKKGVPAEDIFLDHAGFASYDSIYRAKEIFEVKKAVIITQEYHLYRSLYIAKKLGLESYGVASNPREYVGQIVREIREIAARDKDFIKCMLKPEPTLLGEKIPITGNGEVTH